eukprot:1097546-Amphidinium_carterae.1
MTLSFRKKQYSEPQQTGSARFGVSPRVGENRWACSAYIDKPRLERALQQSTGCYRWSQGAVEERQSC